MKYLSLLDIAYIVNAKLIGDNLYIFNISTDTRKKNIRNSLFIIIKRNNKYDINFLCYSAIKNGALAILNNFIINVNISQLIVSNVKLALNKISFWLRNNSYTKILSVTGSTGKTSVKEITVNILKQYGKVLFTYGNFNNEFGAPISLLKLYNSNYKYAVLEFGANSINDIDYLSNIVKPDISCINNISVSHLSGFKNIKNIILCKGKIFKYLKYYGIAIVNFNHYYFYYWKKYLFNKKIIFFSLFFNKNVHVYASDIKLSLFYSYFILNTYIGKIKIFFKLLGIHNILNALASVCFSLSLNISLKDIKTGLESCLPIKGRLYPIFMNKNKIILDDTYNSNPRSLYYSLYFLNKCLGYKVLVISDMSELDFMSIYYHTKIGLLIKKKFFINKVLSIGKYSFYISKYSLIGIHCNNFFNLIMNIKKILMIYDKVTLLIKGSRNFFMDKILNFL